MTRPWDPRTVYRMDADRVAVVPQKRVKGRLQWFCKKNLLSMRAPSTPHVVCTDTQIKCFSSSSLLWNMYRSMHIIIEGTKQGL